MSEKLWQKGYTLNKEIENFTVGNDHILDKLLVKYDCQASAAHAEMLEKIGILSPEETISIKFGLEKIIELDESGKFPITIADEDCHTAIENHLIKNLGETGKKIHTFRSRNDQVLTALRLYYKDELSNCENLIDHLNEAIFDFHKQYGNVELPGFTHTRKAMPSSVSMWAKALGDSMLDNQKALGSCFQMINQSPLGSGAGYGIPYKIDREMTADQLGFTRVQQNSIYVQNSRGKFESYILNALSMIMLDINRIASDLIFFTLPEYDFFKLPNEFLTGSSIMPQKKNPDVLELLRANYHRVVSWELQLKQQAANMISGYHRDMQLTKEPVMNGFHQTKQCLEIVILIFENLKVNPEKCKEAMTDELYATEKAYKLVADGMSFRDAYKKVAEDLQKNA